MASNPSRRGRGDDMHPDNALLVATFDELRRIARRLLSTERWDHTLQTTALVNEGLIKVLGPDGRIPDHVKKDRKAFLGYVRWSMRLILADCGRRMSAVKRCPGGRKQSLAIIYALVTPDERGAADIFEAVDQLRAVNSTAAEVITQRAVEGFTVEQVAENLGIPVQAVKDATQFARAWLYRHLEISPVGSEAPVTSEEQPVG